MTWELGVLIYNAPQTMWEDISPFVRGLLIRAAVHGGVQTIEFELADDYTDAYRWAYDHIGCRLFVYDNAASPPVAEAQVFEPAISQEGNRIIAYGPWLAYCFSEVYNDTASWVTTGTTSEQIADMLTDDCPGVNTDQSNIAETSMNNYPWQPTDNAYPGDLIPQLAALSDATNSEWYFWLQSAPLGGATPQLPIPWFTANISRIYQCGLEDMAPGGIDLTPSLVQLVNDLRVMYRDAVGTLNQTASATDTDSQTRYGLRERYDMDLGLASATAATQYRDMLLARYKDPQQMASFTLNTWLYDEWGGRWPLWRGIADFPFKFTVNDLIPDTTVLGHTLDNKRTFITLACEYDYDSNTLTVTPDTEDNRADAILSRHRTFQ